MSSFTNNQILFGNNSLSNKRFQVREFSFLDSSPNELLTIPISRGSGSSVVRSRTGARKISLAGGYTYTSATADNDNVLIASEEIKRIFRKEKRFLRTCPLSKITRLMPTNNTTYWALLYDAINLTLDIENWQNSKDGEDSASLSFLVDVSNSVNNYAKISYYNTTTNVIDLTSVADSGNFEFWVYFSDAYFVSSIFFSIGNRQRNLLKNSTSINNTDFLYSSTTRTNGATATPNKAGTSALVTTTSTSSPLVRLPAVANNLTLSAGAYTCSIYVKAGAVGDATHLILRHINTPDGTGSGSLTAITGGVSVGNGWYRHSYTRTITGGTDNRFALYPCKSDGSSPTINSTMEISEVQIESGSVATAYQEQGATAGDKYYSQTITTNYEGKTFENGWNYCSVKWGDEVNGMTMTETSTSVDNNYIDFSGIQVNYLSDAEDFTIKLDGLQHIQENYVRNYPCSLDGSVNFEPNWYLTTDNLKNDFELDLLNYTGYAISTHSISLFSQTGITTLNSTKKVDLKGNYEPLLTNTFRLNTVTNLNFLEYENLNTAEKISWSKTWTAGDTLVFDGLETKVETNSLPQDFTGKLPKNILGTNRLRMNIVQSGNTVNSQLVYNSEEQTSGDTLSAQSFVAPITGTLTTAQIYYKTNRLAPNIQAYIYSDSGSLPNTILSSAIFVPGGDGIVKLYTINFSYAVTNGTTYWLAVEHNYGSAADEWAYNSTSVTTGNRARYNGSTWTAEANQDMTYILTFEPTPSTNIDWTCSYKKLYN